jgi:hypothetical protein
MRSPSAVFSFLRDWHAEKGGIAGWADIVRGWFDSNDGVRIHARLAHAIGRATIAIGDAPTDFRGLRAKTVAPPGLCIVVSNQGKGPVTIYRSGADTRRGRAADRDARAVAA